MGIKTYRPYTPSRRHMSGYDFAEITKDDSREISGHFSEEEMPDVMPRVKLL